MTDESFRLDRVRLNKVEDELRASAQSGARRAVGSDKQGAVTIVLEGDSFTIEIADDWEQRVGASGVSASAAEALSAATNARFAESGISRDVPEVADVTPPNAQPDVTVVRSFVDENRNVSEAEFSQALDALVEQARDAARNRINNSGPRELVKVLLAPDGSVNHIVFDEDAVQRCGGRELAADVMAAVSTGQQALSVPLLAHS